MIRLRRFAPLVGLALLVACEDDLDIPDFNNEGLESLIENPTRAAINSATTGLLISGRDEFDDRNGYVSLTGILGRESYNFDGSDPRFITEMLESQLNPSSPAFGGNIWGERYSNIRTGQIVLDAVGVIDDAEMPVEEKEGVRGFVKTMMAHELLLVVNTHDVNGAVVDIPADPTADPGPLVSKAEALTAIESMLDEAADHLDNAGDAFSFVLSSGFVGFDTPATLRQANRGLAARVDVYQEDYAGALTNLGESFLDDSPGANLRLGIYHVFGSTPGDELNDLFDPGDEPDILAHPSLRADAAPGDVRFSSKTRDVASQTQLDLTTDLAFDIYTSNTSPIPIIRNEELILLRAEARFEEGQLALAIDDVNFIRTESGGLAERMDLDANNFEDELLYNRRYSLMFEGGHRWIDARRRDRIEDLPLDLPSHRRNEAFPIPEAECLARGQQATVGGSCQ